MRLISRTRKIVVFVFLTLVVPGYGFPQKSPRTQAPTAYWIAFDCISTSGFMGDSFPNRDICVMDQEGKHKRRLTSDHRSHEPSWSPDGHDLFFIDDVRTPRVPKTEDNTYNFLLAYWDFLNVQRSLFKMDADGQNVRPLGTLRPEAQGVACLPDGRSFAFRISDRRSIQIVRISDNPHGPATEYLDIHSAESLSQYVQHARPQLSLGNWYPPSDYHFVESPFGDFFPFILLEYSTGRLNQEFEVVAPGPRTRLLRPLSDSSSVTRVMTPDGTISSIPFAFDAAWSNDGKRIAYSESVSPEHSVLYIATAGENGISEPRPLTNDLPFASGPAWSPAGTRIAFTGVSKGRAQIMIINDDGTNLVQLAGDPKWLCSQLTWSPDGHWIAAACMNRNAEPLQGSQLSFLPGSARDIFLFDANKPDGKTHRLTRCVSGLRPDCGARNPAFTPASAIVP